MSNLKERLHAHQMLSLMAVEGSEAVEIDENTRDTIAMDIFLLLPPKWLRGHGDDPIAYGYNKAIEDITIALKEYLEV